MNLIGTIKSYHRRWQRFNAKFTEKYPTDSVPWEMISSLVTFIAHQYYFAKINSQLSRKEYVKKAMEDSIVVFLGCISFWHSGIFCLKKLLRFGKYLWHACTGIEPDRTKAIEELRKETVWNQSAVNFLEDLNDPKPKEEREVDLFVRENKVIMIQNREEDSRSGTWEDIRPSEWEKHYYKVVADSAVNLESLNLLRDYMERNCEYIAGVEDLIYSYLYSSTWAISSGHERGLELVTVRHLEDNFQTDKLFSAVVLGVVLKSIEDSEQLTNWKTRLDYDRLLETVDSYGWRSHEMCELLSKNLPDMNEIYPHDLTHWVNLKLRGLEDWNDEIDPYLFQLFGMIGVAREFYLDYWPILSLDSPHKTKVASVLGRLDVSYWYLKILREHPLNMFPAREDNDSGAKLPLRLIFGNFKESERWDVSWIKADTIKVFHLDANLDLSEATIYHAWMTEDWGRNITNTWAWTHHGTKVACRYPVNNKVKKPYPNMILACESKPYTREVEMVNNWLCQYQNYLTIKSLCGATPGADTQECLLTLRGDIGWQMAEITRRWDKWFHDQITRHWCDAARSNENTLQIDSSVSSYLTHALGLLARKRTTLNLFVQAMDVGDCMGMLREFKHPSYVHILMAFHWASHFSSFSGGDNVVPEEEVSPRTREEIKSIFDRVKHYHFPDHYKEIVVSRSREWVVYQGYDKEKQLFTSTTDVISGSDYTGITKDSYLYVNKTKYIAWNSHGTLKDEKQVWDRLIGSLGERERTVLGSNEAKDFLIKSLAYSCLRHSLTAHVCFVAGQRIERGETLLDYGRKSDGDEFTSLAMLMHQRPIANVSMGLPVNPYQVDEGDLPLDYPYEPLESVNFVSHFHSSDSQEPNREVTINHLDIHENHEPWHVETFHSLE